jgi:hypothetical protein
MVSSGLNNVGVFITEDGGVMALSFSDERWLLMFMYRPGVGGWEEEPVAEVVEGKKDAWEGVKGTLLLRELWWVGVCGR